MSARRCRRRQQGVAVLMVLVLLISVGSFVVLRALNEGVQRDRDNQAATAASLAAGEQALLGYALRYPDDPDVAGGSGPGHLPCPDTRFVAGQPGQVPGQADASCAQSAATDTGLLPWRTLGIEVQLDTDGAPLWYAVGDAFRNIPSDVINPDTRGELRLDDCAADARDIAAVLFAPGFALAGQDRSTASAAVRYAPVNYLEGQNATRGDGCFSSQLRAIANDYVRVIDRATLLRAVQWRVLADVANALRRYYADPDGDDVDGVDPDCTAASLPGDCDDALPWLSPHADPTLSAYRSVAGTRAGHLPLRRVEVDFPARFGAVWSLPGAGTLTSTGTSPPDAACVRSTSAVCSLQPTGFGGAATYSSVVSGTGDAGSLVGSCRWRGGTAMRCTTMQTIPDPTASGNRVERSYTLEIDNLPRRLAPPSATQSRMEDVILAAHTLDTDASIAITVADRLQPANTQLGVARLVLGDGALADAFSLLNVPYDLEVDDDGTIDPPARRSPGELPQWFTANAWQQFITVAYAAAYAPGNVAASCTPGADCLTVERETNGGPAVTQADVHALLLSADTALATQARPSADPAQYLEAENASFDDRYAERDAAADFNDLLLRMTLDD